MRAAENVSKFAPIKSLKSLTVNLRLLIKTVASNTVRALRIAHFMP